MNEYVVSCRHCCSPLCLCYQECTTILQQWNINTHPCECTCTTSSLYRFIFNSLVSLHFPPVLLTLRIQLFVPLFISLLNSIFGLRCYLFLSCHVFTRVQQNLCFHSLFEFFVNFVSVRWLTSSH